MSNKNMSKERIHSQTFSDEETKIIIIYVPVEWIRFIQINWTILKQSKKGQIVKGFR